MPPVRRSAVTKNRVTSKRVSARSKKSQPVNLANSTVIPEDVEDEVPAQRQSTDIVNPVLSLTQNSMPVLRPWDNSVAETRFSDLRTVLTMIPSFDGNMLALDHFLSCCEEAYKSV